MDSNNTLQEILEKVKSIEEKVSSINDRVTKLEVDFSWIKWGLSIFVSGLLILLGILVKSGIDRLIQQAGG